MRLPWRGAVLAGGASLRMGRDKATLLVDGEPLWRRQVRVLREAGADSTALVRSPGQPALDSTMPPLRDTVLNAGPLAGLHAALSAEGAPLVAVLAVDMPRIDAAWFRWLLESCAENRGAVAHHASGTEPLAAFYPRAALPQIVRQLARGDYALSLLVASLTAEGYVAAVPLPAKRLPCLANWNFPGDFGGEPTDHSPQEI